MAVAIVKDAAHPAMLDEPTYFTFCTLKETDVPPTGIENVQRSTLNVQRDAWYTLDGRNKMFAGVPIRVWGRPLFLCIIP